MADPHFDDIGACVFDAYGTLFDVNSAVARCRDRLGDKAEELGALWRRKQLEYAWLRSLMGQYEDFWAVTGGALDHAMAALGLDDPGLRARLMQLYLTPDAYDDARPALEALKAAKTRTAILSNGSQTMLVAAIKGAGLHGLIGSVLSVDRVGVYKPSPAVYQLAADELRLPPQRIGFLSANGWDARGAAAFGFRTAWINRAGRPPEALPGQPHAELESLAGLPGLLGLAA